jgi:hypothetical protein
MRTLACFSFFNFNRVILLVSVADALTFCRKARIFVGGFSLSCSIQILIIGGKLKDA